MKMNIQTPKYFTGMEHPNSKQSLYTFEKATSIIVAKCILNYLNSNKQENAFGASSPTEEEINKMLSIINPDVKL